MVADYDPVATPQSVIDKIVKAVEVRSGPDADPGLLAVYQEEADEKANRLIVLGAIYAALNRHDTIDVIETVTDGDEHLIVEMDFMKSRYTVSVDRLPDTGNYAKIKCKECNGRGHIDTENFGDIETCGWCDGTGKIQVF